MKSSASPVRRASGSLTFQIILGMLLGVLTGMYFGASAGALGALGKIVIQLVKGMAVPLIFFAIIETLILTHIPRKSVAHLFVVIAINTSIAATIGLSLSNFFQPGTTLAHFKLEGAQPAVQAVEPLEFSKVIAGYVPEGILHPFLQGNIIGVVILALLIGLAARQLDEATRTNVHGNARAFLQIFERILVWIVHLVPLAVFGVTAKTIGEYGFAPFKGLAVYLALGLAGLALHCLIVYQAWIYFVAKIPLRVFWKHAAKPVVYALGTNSSLATLPVTLNALEELSVSKPSARLGACIATNLNNDGILLYEALAVLFVAQAYGMHLSLAEQIWTACLCVIAAVGVAGVPEAGVISLSLVMTTVGMPLEFLPMLLTVDWVIARARSVTNVLSDMTVSIVIDSWNDAAKVSAS